MAARGVHQRDRHIPDGCRTRGDVGRDHRDLPAVPRARGEAESSCRRAARPPVRTRAPDPADARGQLTTTRSDELRGVNAPHYGPGDASLAPRYTGIRTFARCPATTDWP